LNPVRKSLLSRDGVNEENWMWKMAEKVLESGREWTQCRREAMKGGVSTDGDELTMTGMMPPPTDAGNVAEPETKQRKLSETPLAVYEPHSGITLCLSCFRFATHI
jgi:chromatin structure-remodeling complex protein RSC7